MSSLLQRPVQMWKQFSSWIKQQKKISSASSEKMVKKHVWRLSEKKTIPTWKQWKQLPQVLTKTEKLIFQIALGVGFISLIILSIGYFFLHQLSIPTTGGTYTEGLVGSPQLINPLYATSDVDQDLTHLIYSGLFKQDQKQGLIPDLAKDVSLSEDGRVYTITLRDDAFWHHGTAIKAQDVVFTIKRLQDPAYHSPFLSHFQLVTAEAVDEKTITLTLSEPSALFLSFLTIGILPEELWGQIPPQNMILASLNREPIGSGPYLFEKFAVDKNGFIRSYTLKANPRMYEKPPFIETLIFKFYSDKESALEALENKHVEGLSFLSNDVVPLIEKQDHLQLFFPTSNRYTVLFFNQDHHTLLKEKPIRQAMVMSLDKKSLIEKESLFGWKATKNSVFPFSSSDDPYTLDRKKATELLEEISFELFQEKDVIRTRTLKDSEEREPLSFTLVTADQPEFVSKAEKIKAQWLTMGIQILIKTIPVESLYEEYIASRDYDLLLTSIQMPSVPDPYLFWHSSQGKDPGLNLSQYENLETDVTLEELRKTFQQEKQQELLTTLETTLQTDIPALFLYQTSHPYVIAKRIQNVSVEKITIPADRFSSIASWYIKTKKIWN